MTDYIIIIEKGDGNCSAYCPDLPGVAAAAETEEETAELMRDAIEFHLEGLKRGCLTWFLIGFLHKKKAEGITSREFLPSLQQTFLSKQSLQSTFPSAVRPMISMNLSPHSWQTREG